jgi:nucleotide-binding universal stress UspA family protein
MFPIRTILHPTDYSALARHAYDVAYSLARDYGARLVVVDVVEETHVVEPVTVVELPSPCPPLIFGDDSSRGYHEARKERLRELHPPYSEVRVETHLREGTPTDEILRLADEIDCDLIVIGTHGRTGLERVLMGSVAEAVMRRSRCPVLTVRSPFPRSASEVDTRNRVTATASCLLEDGFVHPFHS